MTKPITPEEVVQKRVEKIPDRVIFAFNKLILQKFDGRKAVIVQDEIVEEIMTQMDTIDRQRVFDEHWLDIEPIFVAAGWNVTYEKATIGDSEPASFIFRKR